MAAFRAASMRARMSARFCEMRHGREPINPSTQSQRRYAVVMMTDDRKTDWAAAARGLPPGSVVVVRARDAARRRLWPSNLLVWRGC
jgi:hypothetical protein